MKIQFEKTWEAYTTSWKVTEMLEKKALFEDILDTNCVYTDPMIQAKGYDALLEYMMGFHQQMPGCYFATTDFMAHNNKSIARWHMCNGEDKVLMEGTSYAEYNDNGQLITMTGFYEMERIQA